MPIGFSNSKKPFEQLDLKGSDLELGTISRLQHSPDTSGISLFVRPKKIRIKGTTDLDFEC